MHMNIRGKALLVSIVAGFGFTASAQAAPCFTVDGTKVTVNGLFSDNKPQVVDAEDMPSVSTVASRGSESHNLILMGIKRDAGKKNVTSFKAKVDGKDYEFPKDACAKK